MNNMETKSIKGRICYKDICHLCGKNRGFVPKQRISKKCKPCAVRINKKGKPSSRNGIKTGKPAWNRGEYYNNKTKIILRDRMSRRLRHA